MSRLLRLQMLRTFEHMLDLNRPSRPHVRPPALNVSRPLPPSYGEVGQAGLCGRLRSNPSSKLQHHGRQRRELRFYSARKMPPRNSPGQPAAFAAPELVIFEQTTPDGMSNVTDKNFDFLKMEDRHHAAGLGRARMTIAGGISGRFAQEKTFLPLFPAAAGYAGSSKPSTTNPPEKHAAKIAESGR